MAVEVIVISHCASGHACLFLLSLTGHTKSGGTIEVYVGHVGPRDAVAVPVEVVRLAKVEIEGVCLWCLARERGRALVGGLSVWGLGVCEGHLRSDDGRNGQETGKVRMSTQRGCAVSELRMHVRCT